MIKRFPASVTRKLKHYVYLYINPETDNVFYVGKGTGSRAFSHLDGTGDSSVAKMIRKLRRRRQEPRIDILIHGLKNREIALAVKMATIDALEVDSLANVVHGHNSASRGRMSVDQVLLLHQHKPVKIDEPAILIRINELYSYGMDPQDLYDSTRGVWRISDRRQKAKYAMAVYEGIVREVYQIAHWLKAGSTFSSRDKRGVKASRRWEFVGTVAPERIRKKYLGRAVDKYFTRHCQNAIWFINC